ncbi:MAG TPA: potassium channel family protein [Gaiella sp.]|nr:potassium channel family protein [Gaiella sp.]
MAGRLEERLQRGVERLSLFRAVRMVATIALSLALIAAVLETIVDSGIDGFNNALWWAIVTVTTVGYGDVVPTTTAGRIIAGALMLVGVSAIPIATSLVVSVFITRLQAKQREQDAAEREQIVRHLERIERAIERMAERTEPSA